MEAETADEWHDFGKVIDRLMFFISLIVLFLVSVWMIAKSDEEPST